MFTTIITDCYEGNEAGRQITRFNSLGLGPTSLIGVKSDFSVDSAIEGGANLVDMLDASQGKSGVVVLNVAPRGNKLEGENGNPFCYFYYKKTLVISTIKGHCLSFVKHFGITNKVNLLELKDALDFARDKNLINGGLEKYITNTQFRSFDFVPRLAKWLIDDISIPSRHYSLSTIHLPPTCIWCIDAFGNAKLSITSNDIPLKEAPCKFKTNLGTFLYYERLKDLPFGKTAIYIGSSGIGDNRFLEFATQGISGSIARKLNLKVGDKIEIK